MGLVTGQTIVEDEQKRRLIVARSIVESKGRGVTVLLLKENANHHRTRVLPD